MMRHTINTPIGFHDFAYGIWFLEEIKRGSEELFPKNTGAKAFFQLKKGAKYFFKKKGGRRRLLFDKFFPKPGLGTGKFSPVLKKVFKKF